MPRSIPSGMKFWQQKVDALPAAEIVKMYEAGYAGVWDDPAEKEKLHSLIRSDGGVVKGHEAAHANGWADSGKGKLIATWTHVEKCFPGCWPGAAQERGDCVSHGQKNANMTTVACEIIAAKPDEATGKVEGIPEIPTAGITEGAFSSEWLYWWRGYNGDGWSCQASAQVSIKHGMMLKMSYPELGIDLTNYSGSLAGKYGSRSPPAEMDAVGKQHLIRTATELETFEEVRDFLANGYGEQSCGSEGYASSRDENGVSRRRGSWAHSMAYIGADDRAETHAKYGGPLVLIMNSWGKWNSGPRAVLNAPGLQIPEGSFWTPWSDCKNRYVVAMSSAAGWPRKTLPDYLAPGL